MVYMRGLPIMNCLSDKDFNKVDVLLDDKKIFQGLWYNHRVSIERKSPYKESYTVNSHQKSFDDVMGDVRACLRIQISR